MFVWKRHGRLPKDNGYVGNFTYETMLSYATPRRPFKLPETHNPHIGSIRHSPAGTSLAAPSKTIETTETSSDHREIYNEEEEMAKALRRVGRHLYLQECALESDNGTR